MNVENIYQIIFFVGGILFKNAYSRDLYVFTQWFPQFEYKKHFVKVRLLRSITYSFKKIEKNSAFVSLSFFVGNLHKNICNVKKKSLLIR